jgi:hypothetical protein
MPSLIERPLNLKGQTVRLRLLIVLYCATVHTILAMRVIELPSLALTMALVQVVPVQTILARKVLFGFLNWLLWNCDKLHQYTLYWSIGISLGA